MDSLVKQCSQCRLALKKNLGHQFPAYIRLVVEWIRKRKTKIQLDLEVSDFLKDNDRKIHSFFLTSLSKLCWGMTSLRIESTLPLENHLRENYLNNSRPTVPNISTEDEFLLKKNIYNDLTLPGPELIRARLYLTAWDLGLTHVEPSLVRFLYCAMKNYLKNILHAAILNKSLPIDSSGGSTRTKLGALSIWEALMRTNYDIPTNLYGHFTSSNSNAKAI